MSYLDTVLTPASGYTQVHIVQVYDAIAAQLTAHPNWQFVETNNYQYSTSGTTQYLYRTHVWRCLAAGSGLPSDFYVIFQLTVQRNSSTGQDITPYSTGAGSMIYISLCEAYDATTHVASKLAPQMNSSAVTLAADRTHPMTWNLATAQRPQSGATYVAYAGFGFQSAVTSLRLIIGVTPGVLFVNQGLNFTSIYAGAFDSILDASADPMPLVLASNNQNSSYSSFSSSSSQAHYASCTRMPMLTPGTAYPNVFGFHCAPWHGTNISYDFGYYPALSAAYFGQNGTLGNASDRNWSLYTGGVPTGRCPLSTSGNGGTDQVAALRGGHRGYLRHLRTATVVSHQFGDTFTIAGQQYVGFGNRERGLWDVAA